MNRDILSCSNVANRDGFFSSIGTALIHCQRKKNFESPPRELQCSDRTQTSTTGFGQPSCVDAVLGFSLKVLVRRDQFQNRRKFHKYTYYTYFIKSLSKLYDTRIPNTTTSSIPSRRHVHRRYRPLLTAAPRVSIVVAVLSFCDVSWPTAVRSLSCSQRLRRMICLYTAVPEYL